MIESIQPTRCNRTRLLLYTILSVSSLLASVVIFGLVNAKTWYFTKSLDLAVDNHDGVLELFERDKWPQDHEVKEIGDVSCTHRWEEHGIPFQWYSTNDFYIRVISNDSRVTAEQVQEWVPQIESLWGEKIGDRIESITSQGTLRLHYRDFLYGKTILWWKIAAATLLAVLIPTFVWCGFRATQVWRVTIRQTLRFRDLGSGHCPKCGYDIKHGLENRCPECGETCTEHETSR